MMSKLFPTSLTMLLACLLAGCGTSTPTAIPSPTEPFGPGVREIPQKITTFTSFRWAADAPLPRDRSDARAWRAGLKGAVERELETRGYKRSTFGRSELELSYRMTIGDGTAIRSEPASNRVTSAGRTGAVLIEARDAETGELIWHAAANTPFPPGMSAEEGRLLLNSYVAAMLRALPPVR
ncbi:MAG: hypothetical protein SNJ52_05085 [Verrucomicrobiia bacterium]